MIFFRAFVAIGMIIGGFIVYPYYLDYIIKPISDMAIVMFPDMNVYQTLYINILPLGVLLMILFFGIMQLLGKVSTGGSNEL